MVAPFQWLEVADFGVAAESHTLDHVTWEWPKAPAFSGCSDGLHCRQEGGVHLVSDFEPRSLGGGRLDLEGHPSDRFYMNSVEKNPLSTSDCLPLFCARLTTHSLPYITLCRRAKGELTKLHLNRVTFWNKNVNKNQM